MSQLRPEHFQKKLMGSPVLSVAVIFGSLGWIIGSLWAFHLLSPDLPKLPTVLVTGFLFASGVVPLMLGFATGVNPPQSTSECDRLKVTCGRMFLTTVAGVWTVTLFTAMIGLDCARYSYILLGPLSMWTYRYDRYMRSQRVD